jgi:cobalt-precorrin 5A hydrolase / precorrin-3B C17-methyltransferase
VDMLTVVLVGSSQSRLAMLGEGPRMYTPRGYARKMDGDLAVGAVGGSAPATLPRDIFGQRKLGDRV